MDLLRRDVDPEDHELESRMRKPGGRRITVRLVPVSVSQGNFRGRNDVETEFQLRHMS